MEKDRKLKAKREVKLGPTNALGTWPYPAIKLFEDCFSRLGTTRHTAQLAVPLLNPAEQLFRRDELLLFELVKANYKLSNSHVFFDK